MAETRPNFYRLLELDPAIDDWQEIRQVLETKKKRWNQIRTQRTGKARTDAEEKLALIPEIERVLGDPGRRRQEAAARRAEIDAEKAGVRQELAQRIETLRALGRISPAQLETLVKQFDGRLERQEIEDRLQEAGIEIGDAGGAPAPFQEREFLGDTDTGEIQHALGVLGLADLYAFLGLPKNASAEALAARGKQLYKESVGKADDKSTAIQKLGGLVETLFSKPGGKESYDATLATLPMRKLHGDIELMVEDGELRFEAFDLLARLASRHGVDPALAKSYVGWFAKSRNWTIAEPSEQPPAAGPNLGELEQRMEAILEAALNAQRADAEQREKEYRQREEAWRKQEEQRRARQPDPPQASRSSDHSPPQLQAPPSLQVKAVPGGFDLEWPPSHEPGVSYWVVRKAHGAPQDEGDGTGMQAVAPRFEDRDVSPGIWHYAVFAMRQDETSLNAAHSGPHRFARRSAAPKLAVAAILLAAGAAVAYHLGLIPPKTADDTTEVVSTTTAVSPIHTSPPSSPGVLPPPVLPPPPPPPPPAKIRQNPKVLVVAAGDRGAATTLETKLVGELGQLGLDVEAGRGRFLTGDYVSRGGASSALALLAVLDKEDVDILVFADLQRLGERELRFLGRSEISYSAQINAQAYLVLERLPLGGRESTQLEYTTLNLGDKLADAVYQIGDGLAGAARSGWSDFRGRKGLTP